MTRKHGSLAMRTLTLVSLLFAAVPTAPAVFTQAARTALKRRIQFGPQNTATLRGALKRGTNHQYILRAREGQKLAVRLTAQSGRAGFTIYDTGTPDPEEGLGLEGTGGVTEWTGTLPKSETGNYTIQIDPETGAAQYTLKVTLLVPPGQQTGGAPSRIEFNLGESTTEVSGTARQGEGQSYLLRGSEGQNINISISSPGDQAYFALYAPDGTEVFDGEESLDADVIFEWFGFLEQTGDYRIVVRSPGARSAKFKLVVAMSR